MSDRRLLERAGLFVGLSESDREQAELAFKYYEIGPGEEILQEGEPDRTMCFVVEGELSASLNGCEVGRIYAGETVGEMAMFGSLDRRSATVTSLTHVRLLVLEEDGMKYLRLAENPVVQRLEVYAMRVVAARLRATDLAISGSAKGDPVIEKVSSGFMSRLGSVFGRVGDPPRGPAPTAYSVLKAMPGFQNRDDDGINRVATRCSIFGAATDEIIVREGEEGNDAFIIAAGRVGVYRTIEGGRMERVATLGAGNLMGQVALTDARGRSATVKAIEPTWLMRIPGHVFRELEQAHSPEGRAFRRSIIDAFAVQLRLANEHYVRLAARWAPGSVAG